jgi:uncharacterized membrane protein YdjX (TVP38/TMEM64 family)
MPDEFPIDTEAIPIEGDSPGAGAAHQAVKAALLLAALFAAGVAIYASPLRRHLPNLRLLPDQIRALGILAPFVFVSGTAALVSVGVPRLLFCPIGGMVFGFWFGILYSLAGTLLGYYGVFLFVRWGGREFVRQHMRKWSRLEQLIKRRGIPAVILARQIPVHGMVLNLVLGLSPVRHRDFLIGTAIGLIPETVPCTLIGRGMLHASVAQCVTYITLAVVLLAGVWIGLDGAMRALRRPAGVCPGGEADLRVRMEGERGE